MVRAGQECDCLDFATSLDANSQAGEEETMNRREFLSAGAVGLGLSAKALAEQLADQKPKRVGIIGPGWYGKCDLFRLIQVSPIEVVSMCDVDKQMLSQAAETVAARQASKKGSEREFVKVMN
jgi:ornithine cyclodeaminase/alanine dehydrogenase-like protein (mu-crystallin family)